MRYSNSRRNKRQAVEASCVSHLRAKNKCSTRRIPRVKTDFGGDYFRLRFARATLSFNGVREYILSHGCHQSVRVDIVRPFMAAAYTSANIFLSDSELRIAQATATSQPAISQRVRTLGSEYESIVPQYRIATVVEQQHLIHLGHGIPVVCPR